MRIVTLGNMIALASVALCIAAGVFSYRASVVSQRTQEKHAKKLIALQEDIERIED